MSQIILRNSGVAPIDAIEFITDDGTGIPVNDNLNVFGSQTDENNDFGIQTAAIPDEGDTVYIQLTNRLTGTVQTTDATVTTIVSLDMPDFPATFYVMGSVQAFSVTNGDGASYAFSGAYRTDGTNSTEIGVEFHDQFEDIFYQNLDVYLSADSANNTILVQVQGLVGNTFNWNCLIQYRMVN